LFTFFDLPLDGALNSEIIYIYPSCSFATQSHSSEIQLHLRFYYQIFGSKLVPEASAAFFKTQDDELCSCDCHTGPLNLWRNSSHEVA